MSFRLNFGYVSLLLVVCFLVGCGGGGGAGPKPLSGDVGLVKDLVSSMQDYARARDTFEPLFVEGKAPDENARRTQYLKLAFYAGEPNIEGDKATIEVEVLDPDGAAEVGEKVEWVAVKVGDKWQLDTAPIPASLGRR